MTTVGHSLIGITIGLLAMPKRLSWLPAIAFLAAMAFLANAPDLPLPYWGHHRYAISHSFLVAAAFFAPLAAALAFAPGLRARLGGWPVVAAAAAAGGSHMLLDSLYSHGHGLPVLWPLSQARLALPIPWLHNIHSRTFDAWFLRVGAFELLTFGPILAACLLVRSRFLAPRRADRAPHGPPSV